MGWHFHPLSHYFEIKALRSQRSWQGFGPSSSSSSNLCCCCTLCHSGRFQNLKPHLCWYCAHQPSTGSSPVSRICIKPPQKDMGKRKNQPNLLQEQHLQPPALSNKRILLSQESHSAAQCPKRKPLCHAQIAAEGKQQAGSRQVSPWGQHIVTPLCSKVWADFCLQPGAFLATLTAAKAGYFHPGTSFPHEKRHHH